MADSFSDLFIYLLPNLLFVTEATATKVTKKQLVNPKTCTVFWFLRVIFNVQTILIYFVNTKNIGSAFSIENNPVILSISNKMTISESFYVGYASNYSDF